MHKQFAIDLIDPCFRDNWYQRPKMQTLLIHKAERGRTRSGTVHPAQPRSAIYTDT